MATSSLPVDSHVRCCPQHGAWEAVVGDRWLARCPACDRERIARELVGRAAIPPRFADRTLGGYVCSTDAQRHALVVATAYAEHFADVADAGQCLLLLGKPGTGKTHLACGIARHVIAEGKTALFAAAIDMVRAVRKTWRPDSPKTEDDVIAGFVAPDLLIIDEVGVQYGTDAEQVTLFDVINRRYQQRRPMILISNEGLDGLRGYLGDRSFDRLREGGGKVVIFEWESYRRQV